MNIAREQISLRRSTVVALQFAPGKNRSQIEALQKFFPRSGIKRHPIKSQVKNNVL